MGTAMGALAGCAAAAGTSSSAGGFDFLVLSAIGVSWLLAPFRSNQHAGPASASTFELRPTGESVNYLCCYSGACSICECIHGVSGAVCAHKPVALDQLWPLVIPVGRAMWNRLAGWRLLHTTDTLDRLSASLGFLHSPNREVSVGNVQARYARNRRRLVPITDTLDL